MAMQGFPQQNFGYNSGVPNSGQMMSGFGNQTSQPAQPQTVSQGNPSTHAFNFNFN